MPIATVIQVPTTVKSVALTFDDGPHPVFTPRALEILKDNKAHATWFVLGSQAQNHPELLNSIVNSGNEIGTHSFDHVNLTKLSRAQMISQLGRTKQLIQQQTGNFWPYFRPTYGIYNDTLLSVAKDLGYKYNVLWSVDPSDYQASTNQIITRVLSAIRPGSIVLLHEVTPQTTMALPVIMRGLRDRGYTALTLTDLLKTSSKGPSQCRYLTITSPYMRGDDVLAVQQSLDKKGFSPGSLDGIYGPMTAAAVRSFQVSVELPSTGNVDQTTFTALGIICPEKPGPDYCRNLELQSPYMRGQDVLAVQNALYVNGFDPKSTDGIYGPLTEAAVVAFQTARGLLVDGIVGPQTYKALGIKCPS